MMCCLWRNKEWTDGDRF